MHFPPVRANNSTTNNRGTICRHQTVIWDILKPLSNRFCPRRGGGGASARITVATAAAISANNVQHLFLGAFQRRQIGDVFDERRVGDLGVPSVDVFQSRHLRAKAESAYGAVEEAQRQMSASENGMTNNRTSLTHGNLLQWRHLRPKGNLAQ